MNLLGRHIAQNVLLENDAQAAAQLQNNRDLKQTA